MGPLAWNVMLPTLILIWVVVPPQLIITIISMKWKAELFEIVTTEYRKCIQISRFGHKEDILTSHGSRARDCDATYPYSSLCQLWILYLTHKHIHFKKIREWVTHKNNCQKSYRFLDFDIRKTYWPLIGHILGNVTLPTPIWVLVKVPT